MITLVDYGLGNVRAFLNVFRRLNIAAEAASSPADLSRATRIIIPGVGHFGHAMKRLEDSGAREVLQDLVLREKVPVLGVCVGMQILATTSEEGNLPGLGWIDGRVRGFESLGDAHRLAVPQMGWNEVHPLSDDGLFHGLEDDARFYFLHSFFLECANPSEVLAVSEYGLEFACAVRSDNIYGLQFHPEKSHHVGIQVLKNFALRC